MDIGLSHVIFFATLGFSLAAPLGPVNMEMIKVGTGRKYGWLYGLITGLGASSGDFLIATIVLFIGTEFFSGLLSIKLFFVLLLLVNAGVLGYIGYGAIRSKTELATESGSSASFFRQFVFGFVLVITSPWSYLWWVSFGPTIISTELPLSTFWERGIVTVMFIVGIWLWLLLLSSFLLISERLTSERILRGITVSSASLILLFAVSIALDAVWVLFTGEPLQLIQKGIDFLVGVF